MKGLGTAIHEPFEPLGGVELGLPPLYSDHCPYDARSANPSRDAA